MIELTHKEKTILIAGFFDGEGCITIGKNGSISIDLVNTCKPWLDFVNNTFNGKVFKRKNRVNKNQYGFRLYGINAFNFLIEIEPFLIDKKNQAKSVIEYFKLRNNINGIRITGIRGLHADPTRMILVEKYRTIISIQKKEEYDI